MRIRTAIWIILVSLGETLWAQVSDMKKAYRIEGSNIVLYLDNAWSRQDQEKILEQAGMKGLSLDTLWAFNSLGRLTKANWKLHRFAKGKVKIYKPVGQLSGDLMWNKVVVFADDMIRSQTAATFGFNEFKRPAVVTTAKGKTQFFLRGYSDAEDVYLSGTFNNWSTLNTPMAKTDSGWIANLTLSAGKHCYKYIVDGHWLTDQENNHRENDFHGGFNSVYFVTNHIFELRGFLKATTVVVSGSFNKWNEKEARLKKTLTGWELPVYLKDGTHEYKFIVDKNWIADPANQKTKNEPINNSVLQLGDAYTFSLKGFLKAREVSVAGNYNNWKPGELKMTRTASGWELPYVLSAGMYQYKFIVDGEWILDPYNPVTGAEGGITNSIAIVKPNHTFILKGKWNARKVEVAGNFNDWSGYTMKKTTEGWMLDVYLPPGKCLYKFIVDGEWITDPANILWEQNEFHNGNSVLWIGPQ